MKTYISNSGVSFNKLVKDKFTVGIRTDKRADKLFGIRPNTSDNNDYQLEVTFNKFMSSNGLIGNGDIYTRFSENDNKINLSDNTILETDDRSFKHYIDIGDIEDDIFIAEYVIDYRGYELDTKKFSTFNLDKPIFKGIKFIEIGQTIDDIDRDYNYDYIWLEKNFENYTYNSTNYKLMDYITYNYKWKEYNKLKMDLDYLTESRYLNFDIDKNVEYKYCGGQLKFKSNNFKVKTIKINRPTFYDEEYNKSEYEGDHIIVINNNNQIKYYKIPSYETIFYKLIEKSNYLDVSGTLSGSVTYNFITTNDIVDGDLCLLTQDFETEGWLVIEDNTIVVGVDNSTGNNTTTSLPTSYPYLAIISSTNEGLLIMDDNDKSSIITYADGDIITWFDMVNRDITLTGNDRLFMWIGLPTNYVACIFSYITLNCGSEDNFITFNNDQRGTLTKDIYGDSVIFNYVNFIFYNGLIRESDSIGGILGYAEGAEFYNCVHNHYGYITTNTTSSYKYIGGSFGYLKNCIIDNFEQNYEGVNGNTIVIPSCIQGYRWVAGFIGYAYSCEIYNVNQYFNGIIFVYNYKCSGFIALVNNSCIIENINQNIVNNIIGRGSSLSVFICELYNSSINNCNTMFPSDIFFISFSNNLSGYITYLYNSTITNCFFDFNGTIATYTTVSSSYCRYSSLVIGDVIDSTIDNLYGIINGTSRIGRYSGIIFYSLSGATITNCSFDINTYSYVYKYNGILAHQAINGTEITNMVIIERGTIDGSFNGSITDNSNFGLLYNGDDVTLNSVVLICSADIIKMVTFNTLGIYSGTRSTMNNCLFMFTGNIYYDENTSTYGYYVTETGDYLTISDTTNPSYIYSTFDEDTSGLGTNQSVNYELLDDETNTVEHLVEIFPDLVYELYPIVIQDNLIYSYLENYTTRSGSSWVYNSTYLKNIFYINNGSTAPNNIIDFLDYNPFIIDPIIDTNAGSLDDTIIDTTDKIIYYYITLIKSNGSTIKDLITNIIDIRDNVYLQYTIYIYMSPNSAQTDVVTDVRTFIVYTNDVSLVTFPLTGIYIPEDSGTIYIQDIDTTITYYSTGTYIDGVLLVDGNADYDANYNIETEVSTFKYDSTEMSISDLQFEYVFDSTKIDGTTWYSNYTKSGNGNNYTDTSSNTIDSTSSNDNGLYFTTIYPLVIPYGNDYIMNNFTNGSGLTYECWVKYDSSYGTIGSRGWVISYETGWGPAMCLSDIRVALDYITENPNIGVTPGFYSTGRLQDGVDNFNLINHSDNEGKVLHLVGYWYNNNGNKEKGIYINNVHYPQISDTSSPQFDLETLNEIYIGNRSNNNDTAHHCKGVKIYSFRLWHTKLSEDEVNVLYNSGKYGSTIISYTLSKEIYLLNNNSIEINSFKVYENGEPIIAYLSIYSNNKNSNYAVVGNTIYVKIITSTNISEVSIALVQTGVYSNIDFTITGAGTTWIGSLTINNDTYTYYDNKIAYFTLDYEYEDTNGDPQSGTQLVYNDSQDDTTDNSTVTIDTTLPVLNTVLVTPNNDNTTKAKTGDIITFKIIPSKTLNSLTIVVDDETLDSKYSSVVDDDGYNYWYAYYTVPEVTKDTGDYTFSFSIDFIDFLEVSGDTVTETTDGNNITIYYLPDVSLNLSLGNLSFINFDNDDIIYILNIYNNSSPFKILKNLNDLYNFAINKGWNMYVEYIPRVLYSKYRTTRRYKIEFDGLEINTYNDYGYYIPDTSGTISFFNKTIQFDNSTNSIYIDDELYYDNDYFEATIDTDETKQFYFVSGSLEIDEANVFDSSTSGDPHIYPVYGNIYELPIKKTFYRLLQGNDLIFNISTRFINSNEVNDIKEYYKQMNNKEAPQSLITNGVFYDNIFIKSDNNILQFNINDDIITNDYFSIYEDEFIIQEKNNPSNIIKQVKIQFNHSIYNTITICINYYENPQTKYGIGFCCRNKNELDGLLIYEYLPSTMELNNINDTELLYGFKFNNKKTSIII